MSDSIQDVETQTDSDTKRLTVQIFGRVQGVGYRYFARQAALGLPVSGFVRNEGDGTVTVVAEGTEDALGELLESLSEGPDEADVDEVETTWGMAFGGFDGFTVKLW